MKLTKKETQSWFITLLEYAGKKRLKNCINVYYKKYDNKLNNKKNAEIMTCYYDSFIVTDCFEIDKFSDRLSNKGFEKYAPNKIDLFFLTLIEVLENAKKYNLIK